MAMRPSVLPSESQVDALERAVCPHCWHRFPPHETLAVARHTDLRSSSVVEGALRFKPSRFTEAGNPIDPMGEECLQLACPRCLLVVTRANLSVPPLFASIVGAPASGKSYYLASATWTLRQNLPRFGLALTDASPQDNALIQANEQRLFLPADPARPVMIPKTDQSGGELYSRVNLGGRSELLLRPFQFMLTPAATADAAIPSRRRLLVLYDNAGEHFLPGSSMGLEATRHLAESRVLMFLFDPAQDPRMRGICRRDDPQVSKGPRAGGFGDLVTRQELILGEMADRIRRLRNSKPSDPVKASLIVVLAKADLHPKLGDRIRANAPLTNVSGRTFVDIDLVRHVSAECRDVIRDRCPEFVACAEATSRNVLYVPSSSLGASPEETVGDDGSVFLGIRPDRIRPLWVDVPFLLALQSLDPQSFPALRSHPADTGASEVSS